ncbi:MAG: peptidoglycan DD-metalloendopeptidase family protein [bacterium]|nr:peptidoglycan DD-metalloendopeptidase family protein [bacterium]
MARAVGGITSRATHAIEDAASRFARAVSGAASSVAHAIGSGASRARHAVHDTAANATHAIEDAASRRARAVGDGVSDVAHAISDSVSHAALAFGGAAYGRTLALARVPVHAMQQRQRRKSGKRLAARYGGGVTPRPPPRPRYPRIVFYNVAPGAERQRSWWRAASKRWKIAGGILAAVALAAAVVLLLMLAPWSDDGADARDRSTDVFPPPSATLDASYRDQRRGAIVEQYAQIAADVAPIASRIAEFRPLIERFANTARISPFRVAAIIALESRGVRDAVSPAGATGLMQLMHDTAMDHGRSCGMVHTTLRKEPEQNICTGVSYYAMLIAQYDGDDETALARYNSGSIDERLARLPEGTPKHYWALRGAGALSGAESRNYVPRVLAWEMALRALDRFGEAPPDIAALHLPIGGPRRPCGGVGDSFLNLGALFIEWGAKLRGHRFSFTAPDDRPYGDVPDGQLGWPSVSGYRVTSSFGMRDGDHHDGIDIAAPWGTPIYASADGIVVSTQEDPGGYGRQVTIEHGDGIKTRYAHASRVLVAEGQTVVRGQEIATVGTTGNSSGPHIHFEVFVGETHGARKQFMDPMPYLL